jgi:hypothetical protein
MVNDFRESRSDLAQVNYSSFLQQILRKLPDYPLFQLSSDRQRLGIQIDPLAKALATTPGVENPLTSAQGVRTATINFARGFREQFPSQIRQIRSLLQQQLAGAIGQQETIQELRDRLILDNFSAIPKADKQPLNLWQDFATAYPNQQTQQLRIETNRPGSESALKFHKLTINVHNTNQVQDQLKQGIENYIASEVDSEEDQEDLYHILQEEIEDELSDFQELQRIVDAETLGKLKKYAQIVYLEYLLNHLPTTDQVGRIYLQDLIRRLKLIEKYINDPSKTDADYEVNYAGYTINYRDAFSRAEAFFPLPIIPIVEGNLGEYTDTNKGETQFICGFKIKLNGKVQAYGGQSSFDYHLSLINPDNPEHKENLNNPEKSKYFAEKVLRRVLLYYFVFASRCNPFDPNYDPNSELDYPALEIFQTKVLPILQGNNDEVKRTLFYGMINGFKKFHVSEKIKRLKELLKNGLEQKTILPTITYPIQITVRKGILSDSDSMFNRVFFNQDITNSKKCLRYISVGAATVDPDALCQIPATIKIEDIRYFTAESHEEFTWKYQVDGIKILPVLWTPSNPKCREAYLHPGFPNSLIVFVYDNTTLGPANSNQPEKPSEKPLTESQGFTYRFVWTLLSYICLDILLEKAPNNLFIPQIRLHQGTHDQPLHAGKFIANLSKSLSHLLREKYRSNSQGFRINSLNQYKIYNGLASLYSLLPKKFRFSQNLAMPTLDKLAIIVVSSRESDAKYGNENRKSRMANLMGEVITVQRTPNNIIVLDPLLTFSENYSLKNLYGEPPILIDTVSNLYRQGYRHFLYIAQAPYTSTLHITKTEQDEGLYFMSPSIITALGKNHADIKIYPVFFDKYYVRKVNTQLKQQSLYVQDTAELTRLSQDPQQQAVVFFNLFNGITVKGKDADDRFYNGVMSYSTLLGKFYPGVLDDQNIRQDLIYQSPLKNDILQYLTLFHFSRFDKTKDIYIKLDPYGKLIGDDSVGALSIFPQMSAGVEFNSLAFLTEVKKVLNVPIS